jgi:hypothetical protein
MAAGDLVSARDLIREEPVMKEQSRIAVFGGIYSNSLALRAALDDARRREVEACYCLGDLGAFGPHPDRVFAATTYGVYRSDNGGAGWAAQTSGLPPGGQATDVAIDPGTPTTVYAAFWGSGIYRTTNAGAATPTWAKLAGGLPTSGFTRIALAVSPSSPQTVYALLAGLSNPNPSLSYLVNQFYRSTDGGGTWTAIPLPGGNLGPQGLYNLQATVDPTTPDIVYLSCLSVWKATRNAASGTWAITQVGANIHPDNHAFAIDPTNHLILYAGSDGGIYASADGGATWSDAVNSGLCITQFEFMAQHPTSDAIVFCGTQDNGTEQFRNSPVFYHADDGDGGFTAVDQNQPKNVLSTYYGPSPKRSTQAGAFGTWFSVSAGLVGSALFYPPMALDETNPNNIAFGTDRINLDAAQGTGGWPTKVTLPGVTGNVSALHYVTSNLLYAGTTTGQVYRLTRSATTWTATALHAAPLPGNWIWEVAARPDDPNTIILEMSGFGIAHVWRGTVPAAGPATWTNVSGTGAGALPDIPANALAIDPLAPDSYYIGTDVAVFRSTNGGTTWTQFSQGLPNSAVFDMRLHAAARVLRVGTHGRGMWERKLDVPSSPAVEVYVRDHLLDTGRASPSPANAVAAFADPLQHVALDDVLNWWMCADVKVDALEGAPPAYQMAIADVDYVAFESKLAHRNPQRGQVNRVYVQVHNRGIQAGPVTVKILYANASAGLPPLPADFWTAFPGNSTDTSNWMPIGAALTVAAVSPTEPSVLEWDWTTPVGAADHSCLLVVVESPSDPIPAASKVFDVNQLVPNERHVGLKNLHVVNAPPGTTLWAPFWFFTAREDRRRNLKVINATAKGWQLGFVFAKGAAKDPGLEGITVRRPTAAQLKGLKERLGEGVKRFDTARLFLVDRIERGGMLADVTLPKAGLEAMLLLTAPARAAAPGSVTVVQQHGSAIEGGSTFVLRAVK